MSERHKQEEEIALRESEKGRQRCFKADGFEDGDCEPRDGGIA